MRAVVPCSRGLALSGRRESNVRSASGSPLVTGPRQVGSSAGGGRCHRFSRPGRSRHFRGQPGTNAARVRRSSHNHARTGTSGRGEGAPSATADSHTAPEVKALAGKDPAPLAFALHPDLQLMAQPDRALVQGTDDDNGSAVACSPVSPTSPRAITEWAEHWNTDPKPFAWKATAEQIITKVRRGHQSPTRT